MAEVIIRVRQVVQVARIIFNRQDQRGRVGYVSVVGGIVFSVVPGVTGRNLTIPEILIGSVGNKGELVNLSLAG